ncbi:hypothetical protein NOR_07702 [Metarhizium rileyi]|uniref:Uncharacterized protein n=1 Tax=Metarhizium rileyi (strain RCEF 4871) TaxID=1649241 RepID=A0A166XRD9_METRR|nr:hypothetical protein NOR_07702 [Metarhizium rileyi RCEF 4871]
MAAAMPLAGHIFPSTSPMATEQTQKRRATDDISQSCPSPKKRPNFPSSFYDELSDVPLTFDSLQELDRRNKIRVREIKTAVSVNSTTKSLLRFSRRGGADLRHLRGFASSKLSSAIMDQPLSSGSSQNRATQSTRVTRVTNNSSRSARSSVYDKGFQQYLIDYKIYPEGYEVGNGLPTIKPSNLDSIQEALRANRASLSPSQFTQEAFQDFKSKNTQPITSTKAVKPKPDLFDGAFLEDINKDVRDDPALRPKIIPTKHHSLPVASNFFMEVKGPDGNASVAQRQACYDGAYGARAMHALQNHGKAQLEYDENAYAYSSTYHPATGTLQLYAHHVIGPADTGGRPGYHMTQLDTWGMTGNIDTFRHGATAFRNTRDLARRHRDHFIKAANCSQNVQQNDEDVQNAHDYLQQQIADTCDNNSGEDPKTHDALQSLQTDDDTPNPSQASTILAPEDPALSFATSFASSSGNGPPVGTKRVRQLNSPNNSWGRSSSKSRTRIHINQLDTKPSRTEDSPSTNRSPQL